MKVGFGKADITPRIGVELSGFGPFLMRRSIGIRDRLWAKAIALNKSGKIFVLVSCDLVGMRHETVMHIRHLVRKAIGIPPEAVMVHCTHTHSGPATQVYRGWGEVDHPYLEILPIRIADACIRASENLQEALISYAQVPCEGIGLNREYDKDAPPLKDVLKESWRPEKPELTDTECSVLTFHGKDGVMIGFMSYFGCHPVVCCQETRYIHGDYPGVATNMLENEYPGAIGLFLQGAQGDVNSCVVHKPEKESLLALDIIAGRYARAVRLGINTAKPLRIDSMSFSRRMVKFTRKNMAIEELKQHLSKNESVIHSPSACAESFDIRMAMVYVGALRERLAAMESNSITDSAEELQGLRLGPVAFLGAPLEIFQAIKNDVKRLAESPFTLIMGLTNGSIGYAPDKTTAARGGYAADMVPMMMGQAPFKDIHTELSRELVELERIIREEPGTAASP
jgi:hypothetical protein